MQSLVRIRYLAAALSAIASASVLMWVPPVTAEASSPWSYLENYHLGQCLHSWPADLNVTVANCDRGMFERWKVAYAETLNGSREFVIFADGILNGCLHDDSADVSSDGADAVNVAACNPADHSVLWTRIRGDVAWEYRDYHTGLCLTYDSYANAITWRCNSNHAEQWTLTH